VLFAAFRPLLFGDLTVKNYRLSAIRTQATESVVRNINVLEKQLLDVELKLLEMQEDSPGHQLYSKRKKSLTEDIDAARKRMKPPPTPGSTQSH